MPGFAFLRSAASTHSQLQRSKAGVRIISCEASYIQLGNHSLLIGSPPPPLLSENENSVSLMATAHAITPPQTWQPYLNNIIISSSSHHCCRHSFARTARLVCTASTSPSSKIQGVQMETQTDLFEETQLHLASLVRRAPSLRFKAAKKLRELTEELAREEEVDEATAAAVELHPLEKIKKGFMLFKNEKFLKQPNLYGKLKTGQNPKVMVIACSDSRVCPTHILGLQPGEAFVVRNVANLIPSWGEKGFPGTSAALEFAVLQLKVEHILIIGHTMCGGISALMSMPDDGRKSSDFIENWIEIGKPARARVKALFGSHSFQQQCHHCEKESVNMSLTNLLTFPWIKDLVSQGKLSLHGGYYNFLEGSFQCWNRYEDKQNGNSLLNGSVREV